MKQTLLEMYSAMTTLMSNLEFYEDWELIYNANETLENIASDDPETIEYLAGAFLDELENNNTAKAEKITQSVFWLLADEMEKVD